MTPEFDREIVSLLEMPSLFPNGSIVELENAGYFCQEDQPDLLVALIDQFIQLT